MGSAAAADEHLCWPSPARQKEGEGAFHHLSTVLISSVELIILRHNVSAFFVIKKKEKRKKKKRKKFFFPQKNHFLL